jgi:hypothetical protein
VKLPRSIELEPDARMALGQIIGIMSDQAMSGTIGRWDLERLMELEMRLGVTPGGYAIDDSTGTESDTLTVTLGIDDAALLLDGMAFTEIASADLPWIEMVRWTSDFVTRELRSHWSDVEWLALTADPT